VKFKILSIGKIKNKNLATIARDFEKRISHDAKLEMIEIKDSNPQIEEERISIHLVKNHSYNITMSEEGDYLSSQALALLFKSRTEPITFIIGGPDGLSDKVKKESQMTLSLSPMTFTHEMAKIFLLEQIYRAISIIKNRNYHKG